MPSNLDSLFKGFIFNLIQELYKNSKAYSLDSFILIIIDKVERLNYKLTKAFLSIIKKVLLKELIRIKILEIN